MLMAYMVMVRLADHQVRWGRHLILTEVRCHLRLFNLVCVVSMGGSRELSCGLGCRFRITLG